MKINKDRSELRDLNATELQDKIELLRKELFTLKLNASTAHIKDYSQYKKLRANIARALTYMQQKQSSK